MRKNALQAVTIPINPKFKSAIQLSEEKKETCGQIPILTFCRHIFRRTAEGETRG